MYSSMKHLIDDEIYSVSEDTNASNNNTQNVKRVKTKKKSKKREVSENGNNLSIDSSVVAYKNNGYQSDNEVDDISKEKVNKTQEIYDNISNASTNSTQDSAEEKQSNKDERKDGNKTVGHEIQSEVLYKSKNSYKLKIIGVYIHQLSSLKRHPYVNACMLKIYIYNYDNDKCLNNTVENNIDIKTHIWHRNQNRYSQQWNELIVFNKLMISLLEENVQNIIFFQLYEVKNSSTADFDQKEHNIIGWSFLKNCKSNYINKKLKLQMYEPSSDDKLFNVYNYWKTNKWKLYPGTIEVTIKGHIINTDDEYISTIQYTAHSFITHHYENVKAMNKINQTPTQCTEKYRKRNEKESSEIFNCVSESIHHGGKECFVMKFSRSGNYIAIATKLDTSYVIHIFKVPCFTQCAKLTKHNNIIYDLSWNFNDTLLISASSDCTVCVWEVNDSKFKLTHQVSYKCFVYAAKFCQVSENIAATGGFDKIVKVWNVNRENKLNHLQELCGHEGFVNAICFGKQNKSIYSGDSTGVIIKWNYETNEWHQLLSIKSSEIRNHIINDLILFPNGQKLLIVLRNSVSWALDTSTSTLIHCYRDGINCKYQTRGCISPCGNIILIGNCIWSSTTAQLIAIYNPLIFDNQMVTAVDCHPYYDMTVIACGFTFSPVLVCTNQVIQDDKKLNMELFVNENENVMEHLSGNRKNKSDNSFNNKLWTSLQKASTNLMTGGVKENSEVMQSFKLQSLINKMDMAISKVKKENKIINDDIKIGKTEIVNDTCKSPTEDEYEELKIDIRSQNSDGTYTVDNENNNDNSTLSEAESIVTYTISPKREQEHVNE